jgi:hypothetical protein
MSPAVVGSLHDSLPILANLNSYMATLDNEAEADTVKLKVLQDISANLEVRFFVD